MSTSGRVRLALGGGAVAVVSLGILLVARANSHVNKVTLDSLPKGVTTFAALASSYRPSRRYVGTLQPWVEARIGPQLISAYVDTVVVRPGDVVKRGQVLATLDCRNASASSRAVAMQARAVEAQQEAIAHEAARIAELKEGGFASTNEIEKRAADSTSKTAEVLETGARMQRATLEVNDCVLRAPFAGEIAARAVDPGAFIRPGTAVVTLIDRDTVRIGANVPEADFAVVGPGTPVRIGALATKQALLSKVARRSPAADEGTRTIPIEIDVPDPDHQLPVGTTAELAVDVGEPTPATEIPLTAASVRGARATVYRVDGGQAYKEVYAVVGEREGRLFVEPRLREGTPVVTEGRASLKDGDRVAAKPETLSLVSATPAVPAAALAPPAPVAGQTARAAR